MTSDDYLATFTPEAVQPVNGLWGIVHLAWTFGPLKPDLILLTSVPEASDGSAVFEEELFAATQTEGAISARVGGWQNIWAQPLIIDREIGGTKAKMPDADGNYHYYTHFITGLRIQVPAPDEEESAQDPLPVPIASAHAQRWGIVDVQWTSSYAYNHYDVKWNDNGGATGVGGGRRGTYPIERARAGQTYTAAVRGIFRPTLKLSNDKPSSWSAPVAATVPDHLGYQTPNFDPNSRLSAMATHENTRAVVVGADHQAWCATRDARMAWHMWVPVPGVSIDPAGRLGAVARAPAWHLIGAVDSARRLVAAGWHHEWDDWAPVGDGDFEPYTSVSMAARNANHQDIAAVDSSGHVLHASWHGGWFPMQRIGDVNVPAGAPVALAARSNNYIDAVVVGDDGHVYHATWHGGWAPFRQIPGLSTYPGASVALDRRNSDHFMIFCLDNDARPMSNFWHGHWRGWVEVGGNHEFPPESAPAVTHFDSDNITAALVDYEGAVMLSHWNGSWSPWSYMQNQPETMHPSPVLIRQGDKRTVLLGIDIENNIRSADPLGNPPRWSQIT